LPVPAPPLEPPLPDWPPIPAPPLFPVLEVPVGVPVVAGGVVTGGGGGGVVVVAGVVTVCVGVVVVVLCVVVVGVVLVVVFADVDTGFRQSWAALRPTTLAPWSRFARSVPLTEAGRPATWLLKLLTALWACPHCPAPTAAASACLTSSTRRAA